MDNRFEVIIVGAGPAACGAATFLARANIKTFFIGDPAQSGLMDASEVWNYPGFPKGVGGSELLDQMREQATSQGATFMRGEVTHIEKITDKKHTNILENVGMLLGKNKNEKGGLRNFRSPASWLMKVM